MVLKKKLFKHFILLLILALFFVGCYNESKINYTEIEYSEFLENGNMKSKLIGTDNELEIKKFQKSHLD